MNIDIGKIANAIAQEIEKKLVDAESQLLTYTGQLQGVKLLYEEIKKAGASTGQQSSESSRAQRKSTGST